LFVLAALAYGVDTLVIPQKIAYTAGLDVRDAVRNECRLEEKLLEFIKENAKGAYANLVYEKPTSGEYHVLAAEIVAVVGGGGGAWSGAKAVKIKGTLTDQAGKVLGTFDAGRYSGGGAFGGYKGTCAILGRCTKTLGKDVAAWLVSPAMDSHLGDH